MDNAFHLSVRQAVEKLADIAILNTRHRISVELIGPPGCGKTDGAMSLPDILSKRTGNKWALAVAHPANYSPVDVIGFLIPNKLPDGTLASTFTQPPWMRCTDGSSIMDHEFGVLIFDEFGQADSDVQKPLAEVLLHGRVGPHQIPPGWLVIATSNRKQDRSGVGRQMDFIINRRMEIHIKPEFFSWEHWATGAGVLAETISFARENMPIVFASEVPKDQGPWCTSRSLVAANHVLEALAPRDPDGEIRVDDGLDPALLSLIAGQIGPGAAMAFNAHLRLKSQLPSWQEVVGNPHGAPVPQAPDAQMMGIYSFAMRVDENTLQPVLTYVDRFPKEFAATFVRAAIRQNRKLLTTRPMINYVAGNAALISLTAEN